MVQLLAFITLGFCLVLLIVTVVFCAYETRLYKRYRTVHKRNASPDYFRELEKSDKLKEVLRWTIGLTAVWIALFAVGMSFYLLLT